MTASTVVVDCSLCGGRDALQAERVPTGAERAAGLVRGEIHALRCPRCAGQSARLSNGPQAVSR